MLRPENALAVQNNEAWGLGKAQGAQKKLQTKPEGATVQTDHTTNPRCYEKHKNSGFKHHRGEQKCRHSSPELNRLRNLTSKRVNYHVNYKITT